MRKSTKAMAGKQIDVAAVRRYLDAGFVPIPLHRWNEKRTDHKKDGRVIVRDIGKAPRDSNWSKRLYDPERVLTVCMKRGWNIGIRVPDSWLVIDVDVRRDGDDGFANLVSDFRLDARDWPRVRTGSGGYHWFLRIPAGLKIRDTLPHDSDTETEFRYSGCEFKGLGRQMVAAGSWHPCGGQYAWDRFEDLSDAPDVPAKLVRALTRPIREGGAVSGGHVTPERLARALSGLDPEQFDTNDKWEPLMMACHHATGGDACEEFIAWSTSHWKFADDAEVIGRRWDSLHADRDNGFTAATINMHLEKAERLDLFLSPHGAREDFDDGIPWRPVKQWTQTALDHFNRDFLD